MSPEPDDAAKLEVAHILFTDIVGFSKLSMEEQKKTIQYLGKLVRETQPFREADANNLIRITTGDGFALVFFDDPEAPIKCARELGRRLRAEPRVKLRMGVHSGAVYRIPNLNERTDVTGTGINMAQRVMDSGDAGHILASGAVANILGGLDAWAGDLHDLERVEIKGGDRIRIYNVYGLDYGNPERPAKLSIKSEPEATKTKGAIWSRFPFLARRKAVSASVAALVLVILGVLAVVLFSGSQQRSLAVVPFAYENDDEKTLADDLQMRLASNLSELPKKLSVKTSNKPIYSYYRAPYVQELGRSLGAQALLKGNLKKSGDNIVVDVQLVDIENGKDLWTNQYSGRVAEVGAVEQDILQKITEGLSISLTDSERQSLMSGPSKSAAANRLYEEGLSKLAARDLKSLEEASAKFKEAVGKEDPNFARGFAKLADSLVLRYVYGTPSEGLMTEAEDAANHALRIRPTLADAHVSLAYIYFRHHRNWAKAEEQFKAAIQLDPLNAQAHDWYADYLEAMNRSGEAVDQMLQAVKLDSGAIWINADLGLAFCYANRFDDASKQLMMTLGLNSSQENVFAQTHNYLGLNYERKGELKDAIAEYEKAVQLNQASSRLKAILAHAYALQGQTEKARQLVNGTARDGTQQFYYLALAYAALPNPEDRNLAFEHLKTAVGKNEPGVVFLQIDPRFSESFRKDLRFNELLTRLNFPRP
jgi:TolB-like protein/class 3 adenylate cyclase/Tfp pilus assembly protein PilF